LYNIIAPIYHSQIVGTGCITPPDPLSGFGVFCFYKFYRLFRYGLSRRPGSEDLKIVNRALSRFAVASYLLSCNVPMRLEVLNAGGSLLSILSLSLIISISTNLDRIINYISCEVAL